MNPSTDDQDIYSQETRNIALSVM